MYRETAVPLARLQERILTEASAREPLGAYASADRLYYLFLEEDGVLAATVTLGPQALVPSLTSTLPLFDWHEREMRQQQGILFAAHPDPRPLFAAGSEVPEALTAQGKGVSIVVVGPVHAGVIEPGRFTFSTGGETVIHLEAQLSYAHRGLERFLEGREAVEAAYYLGRLCGGCSAARSWAYARALEELAGSECADSAEHARVVFAELERLYNHLFDLASAASGAGYGRGLTVGLGLKERVLRLCAEAAGHRLLFDAICPGGVRDGVLRNPTELRAQLRAMRGEVDRFTGELFENGSVVRRFEGAGVLTPERARAFGAVGPARRASGGTIDVRNYAPYGDYRQLGVRPAHASAGDVFARCDVKRQELAESFRLLDESLAALEDAPPCIPQPLAPGQGNVTTVVEGPRGAESVSVETDARGRLLRLHAISASYRNWPVVVEAMEGNIMPDFPLINKSFNLCYSCADR